MADSGLVLVSIILLLPLTLVLFLFLILRPRPVKIPIKGRHVFITGGSSGIGLSLAQQTVLEGARVSILARNLDKLDEAKQSIRLATGIDVAVFSADVRDYDAVKSAVEEAGPIDVLVCNQGVFIPQELENQEVEEVKFMIDVNLMGTFHLIKAALPGMKNRTNRGPASIAIMSSQAGQVGIYGYTAYSASKFGLKGMAEALQQEVIADNIHVSLVFPPDTDTPGFLEGCINWYQRTEIQPQCLIRGVIMKTYLRKMKQEFLKPWSGSIDWRSLSCNLNINKILLSLAPMKLQKKMKILFRFNLQPQHQQDTVVSGSDETAEKDENPLQVQPEIKEEENQVIGDVEEISQMNGDELLKAASTAIEEGKPTKSTILRDSCWRFMDLAAPLGRLTEEKTCLGWFTMGLKREIRVGLWLHDPGGFKGEFKVQIRSRSYGLGTTGQNKDNRVSYFLNPNFSSTKTLVSSSPTPNPRHNLTNPNSPSSKTLISLPPLFNPPHDHPNPNTPSTVTLSSPPPLPLRCDLLTSVFRQRSDAKLHQLWLFGLYFWCNDDVAHGHKCERPKLDIFVTRTKSVDEDSDAANFKCVEDTKNDFESYLITMKMSVSLVLNFPTQFPSFLHTLTCSGLCNESVIQYNPGKRNYDRIEETTKVDLRVFTEWVGLLIFNSMSYALNLLSKHQRASYCNCYWENQFQKASSKLELYRDHNMMNVLCRRKQMEIMFSKCVPESKNSRRPNMLCYGDGSVNYWAPIIRTSLESKFCSFDEKDTLGSVVFASRRRPMGQQSLSFEDEKNMAFIGLVGMLDSPGEKGRKVILSCLTVGIRVVLVTSDNKTTADSLRKKLGPFGMKKFRGHSYTTSEFEELPTLQRTVEVQHMTLFTRVVPSHKKILLEALQHHNEVVAMTGDGVNDESARVQFSASEFNDHLHMVRTYDAGKYIKRKQAEYEYFWGNVILVQTLRAIDSLGNQFLSLLRDTGLGDNVESCYSSVNLLEPKNPFTWLTVDEKKEVNSVFLRESTATYDYVVFLFGGSISRFLKPTELWKIGDLTFIYALSSIHQLECFFWKSVNNKEVQQVYTFPARGWFTVVLWILWWLLYSETRPKLPCSKLMYSGSCSCREVNYPYNIYDDRHFSTALITVLEVVRMFIGLNYLGEITSFVSFPLGEKKWLVGWIIKTMVLQILIWYGPPVSVLFYVTPLTRARSLLRNEHSPEVHLEDKVSVLGGGIVTPHTSKRDKRQVASGDQQYGTG